MSGGPYGDHYPTNQISFQFCGDDTTPIHAEQALEPPAVIYFQQLRQVVILTFPEGTFEEWYEPYYPTDPVEMFITMVGTGLRGTLRSDGQGYSPVEGTKGVVRYGTNYVSRVWNNPPSQPQWQDYVEIDLDAPETQLETQYECIVASLDSGPKPGYDQQAMAFAGGA